MLRNHQTHHAGTAGRPALYARIARRLGVPHAEGSGNRLGFTAAEIACHMRWLERAEAAECQLGRAGSWAHDANRLLALRQARELAHELSDELVHEPVHEPAGEPAQEPVPDPQAPVSPSRESFPPARDGQAR
ncbi:hypothetical protein [Stappia sp.]|uniref:hypothetical protein n=1 Tax=Stappia sp. TaxID=1870903 RepID=UPI003A99530E